MKSKSQIQQLESAIDDLRRRRHKLIAAWFDAPNLMAMIERIDDLSDIIFDALEQRAYWLADSKLPITAY